MKLLGFWIFIGLSEASQIILIIHGLVGSSRTYGAADVLAGCLALALIYWAVQDVKHLLS